MDRRQLESLARQLMTQARGNLTQDGYVAFAVLLVTKDNDLVPVMTSTANGEAKEALATFLRMLAPHLSAIFLISEAWTLIADDSLSYARILLCVWTCGVSAPLSAGHARRGNAQRRDQQRMR